MLQVIAELQIEEDDQGLHQLRVVDQMGGPQQLLPQLTQFQPADTPERLEAFLARLHAYPAFMAANTEILREALASGLTAPRIVAERTIAQIERMLAIPIESGDHPVDGHRSPPRPTASAIRDIVRDVVYPADARLPRGAPAATTSPPAARTRASGRRPNGEALYRTAIRSWTTLDLDPEEVHRIGLDELDVDRGRAPRDRRAAAGFGDDTAAYRAALDADAAQHAPDQGRARRPGAPRTSSARWPIAPRYFGRPAAGRLRGPRGRGVQGEGRAVRLLLPADAATARATGIYYANGYDLPSRKYTKLASTTYHEAAPGHHFQIALEMENPHLNTFRRLGARMVGGAYVEGWGLYSERLADEMGLYRDEGERFGMLDAQAWRAARLVVDTGLHALRWPRQRSIDFLQDGRPVRDRRGHRDRPLHLLAGPGADLQDRPARDRAAARRARRPATGRAFDLRAFHDAVLGHGSLPLATLARELPTWVATPV